MNDFDDAAIPPAPLDLRAVQLRLIAGGAAWADEEVAALLAHCRALTERLASSTHAFDAMARLAGDETTREVAAVNRDRNRAVLAAARDGPA